MVANYQILLSIHLSDKFIRILNLHMMTDISKDINRIIFMNYGIEILQQNPVHLFYRFKWAALHIYNGSVAKVHICRKINHISFLSDLRAEESLIILNSDHGIVIIPAV